MPPTRALTATSRLNWARLARSPSRIGRRGSWCAVIAPVVQGAAGGAWPSRPVRRPATVTVGAPARSSRLAAVIGALAVPAHHHDRPARQVVGACSARAPSSMWRAPGRCPAAYSVAWRTSSTSDASDLVGADQRGGGDRRSGGGPGGDAAGELAGEVVVADLERLPDDLGRVLVGVADDDQRPVGRDQPAEPGGERRPQRDRHRAGHVAGGVVGDRPYVDHDRARRPAGPRRRDGRARAAPARRATGRAAPVDLAEPQEVRRIAAQPASSRATNVSSSGRRSSGLVAFSRADRGGALGAGRGGAERARAVGRPHRGRRPGSAASRCSDGTGRGPAPRCGPARPGRCGRRSRRAATRR